MASSSFSGPGKTAHSVLSVFLASLVLLHQGVLVRSGIMPLYENATARIQDDVTFYFEFCEKGGKPSCTQQQTFNLSAPNPDCTADRHGHCIIGAAPEDHPLREGLHSESECELCELSVRGVTLKDAGQYFICRLSACHHDQWRNISFLKIIENVATTVTTRPTTREVSTTPTPEIPKTPTSTDIIDVPGTEKPTSQPHPEKYKKISSAVGIPVTIIVIICVVVYLYKKRNRRQLEHVYYSPSESPLTNGNTTTVNINVNNADGCSIEIEREPLKEDPISNT